MKFETKFTYNPITGDLISKWKGRIVGGFNGEGYLKVSFEGKYYYVHRIIWYLHYGTHPTNTIDHINCIRSDNRIENLEDITFSNNVKKKRSDVNWKEHYASELIRIRERKLNLNIYDRWVNPKNKLFCLD